MPDHDSEFLTIAEAAAQLATRQSELDDAPLEALESAAEETARAWSGSNLGYQANVYYAGYRVPPPGAYFSREWGFEGMYSGTRGDWIPNSREDVVEHIQGKVGNPDLRSLREASSSIADQVQDLIDRARSLAATIPEPHDAYLRENLEELHKVSIPGMEALCRHQWVATSGQFAIRDMRAAEGGWQTAGHQIVIANVMAIRAPYAAAKLLSDVCRRLGRHLEAANVSSRKVIQLGSKVFIGHGGLSKEYLQLGVWLTDRGLDWDVFDRKPTAGLSTKERLTEMLDNAVFAFLIMSAEDDAADGKLTARANVVHEVGLFQGRLGWTKAIVLLEEGCEEFSNIVGIGQIRFPKGNVASAFDEIRQVLEREGLL